MKTIQKTMTKTKIEIGCQEQHWCKAMIGQMAGISQHPETITNEKKYPACPFG